MMVTIARNLLDFHFVDGLLKAQTFNASYILQQILGLRPKSERRHLVTLADNARPYFNIFARIAQCFLAEFPG
jgi:hypothetical protein